MGSWVLLPYGIELLSNNQSESFNASMMRLINWKEQTIDVMANSLRKITLFYEIKIRRGWLGCHDYTLRPHLSQSYKNMTLKKPTYQSMDDLFDQMKASRPTPKMVNLIYYMIIIHMLILYNFSKVMDQQGRRTYCALFYS
jgi:hypothetical protein